MTMKLSYEGTNRDSACREVGLEFADVEFAIMKERGRECGVGAGKQEDIGKIVRVAGAAGSDNGDRDRRANGPRQREIEAGLRAVPVDARQ
jgi:hypothetical protein